MSLSRPLVRTAIVGATVALTALGLSPHQVHGCLWSVLHES